MEPKEGTVSDLMIVSVEMNTEPISVDIFYKNLEDTVKKMNPSARVSFYEVKDKDRKNKKNV